VSATTARRIPNLPLPRPSFAAIVLAALAGFFFLAATNTLAGWLYVLCALQLGVLAVGCWLSGRELAGLTVERTDAEGAAGAPLQLTLRLGNPSRRARQLLTLTDERPPALGGSATRVVETVAAGETALVFEVAEPRRGVHRWEHLHLRTAAPLGLFWRQRQLGAPVTVTVWPRIWPLAHCRLLVQAAEAPGKERARLAAVAELPRSLRPYRPGDGPRMIHWRTSARRGELLSREFEQEAAGDPTVLALDATSPWSEEAFEAALEAVASLVWAARTPVAFWTGEHMISDRRAVLYHLAALTPAALVDRPPPTSAVLWCTADASRLASPGRKLQFGGPVRVGTEVVRLDPARPLGGQLEVLT